jgi:hypothetical protein
MKFTTDTATSWRVQNSKLFHKVTDGAETATFRAHVATGLTMTEVTTEIPVRTLVGASINLTD